MWIFSQIKFSEFSVISAFVCVEVVQSLNRFVEETWTSSSVHAAICTCAVTSYIIVQWSRKTWQLYIKNVNATIDGKYNENKSTTGFNVIGAEFKYLYIHFQSLSGYAVQMMLSSQTLLAWSWQQLIHTSIVNQQHKLKSSVISFTRNPFDKHSCSCIFTVNFHRYFLMFHCVTEGKHAALWVTLWFTTCHPTVKTTSLYEGQQGISGNCTLFGTQLAKIC